LKSKEACDATHRKFFSVIGVMANLYQPRRDLDLLPLSSRSTSIVISTDRERFPDILVVWDSLAAGVCICHLTIAAAYEMDRLNPALNQTLSLNSYPSKTVA
jgi:hypothetical protein